MKNQQLTLRTKIYGTILVFAPLILAPTLLLAPVNQATHDPTNPEYVKAYGIAVTTPCLNEQSTNCYEKGTLRISY